MAVNKIKCKNKIIKINLFNNPKNKIKLVKYVSPRNIDKIKKEKEKRKISEISIKYLEISIDGYIFPNFLSESLIYHDSNTSDMHMLTSP